MAWAKGVLEHPPNTEQIQGKAPGMCKPGKCAENEHWTISAESWKLHLVSTLLSQTFTVVGGSWNKNEEKYF